ncbi:hypothetical protein GYMLUDRAFT_676038 [Collybiopsis luxurians FD-317 M1]|uniref:cystathionine gamma-lyase n=1 Tax=Collybiopsis luxurians FD-317 M1 TaxID=944289 RepID=A0A0D0CTY9_9AGAR|nr:hypothetical protein GYMLUDRAFT_676038 [Collybiopsis luxurians FD-317 M1]
MTLTNGHTNGVHTNGNGHTHTVPNGHSINDSHSLKNSHLSFGFGTRAIHVGSEANSETGAVIPPISLSTTYKQDGVGRHKGFEYSRSSNPNRDALEKTLASVEAGGAHALAFASGSATTATVIQSLTVDLDGTGDKGGAHIISVNDVYGGTFRYMSRVATTTQNVKTSFLDLEDLSEGSSGYQTFIETLRSHPNTKLIWVESPTNPTLRVIDIQKISDILDSEYSSSPQQRPLLLVDNTFSSPFYTSPLLLGADIVLHSLTKYINGHSDVVMGAIILPARHAHSPNSTPLLERLRFLQNASGAVPSSFDSWLAQRGLKTLHLRMKTHGQNAVEVARALGKPELNEWVEEVIYPGYVPLPRPGNEEIVERARGRYVLAKKNLSPHARRWIDSLPAPESAQGQEGDYHPDYPPFPYSGMISIRLRSPSRSPDSSAESLSSESSLSDLASDFLSSLHLFTLAESLGGVESLAEVPAQMTHASIPKAEREKLGISDGLVRLSVGVEEGGDLVRDLVDGLQRVFGGRIEKL